MGPTEARSYLEHVRERTLEVLDGVDLGSDDPLLHDGFVYGLVLQHELQHQETMLQTLQLFGVAYATPPHDDLRAPPRPEDVLVPAGQFTLGTGELPWAYDNEQPPHAVELPAFSIERHPVTNERFAEFVEDGGYRKRRYWGEAGWEWRSSEGVDRPRFWEDDAWRAYLGPNQPVVP